MLPPLYAAWMEEVLAAPVPEESKATCDDCVMCAKGDTGQTSNMIFFNPKIKCCTYLPEVYNFLAGRVFMDEDPAMEFGRATLEERFNKRVAVTPLGIGQTPAFSLLYKNSPGSFGHSENLRCPHYIEEGGRCGIWRHRNSVCTTWFCKFERGMVSWDFWKSVHQLLSSIEITLARWCVLELDVGTEALRKLFPLSYDLQQGASAGQQSSNLLSETVSDEDYRQLWGKWHGREIEFYKECAGRVNGLPWNEILRIGGPEIQAYARLVQQAYQKLADMDTPAALKVGQYRILSIDRSATQVQSFSPYDTLRMPRKLADLLPYFDGRPTAEVLEEISAREGVKINRGLVRKLSDFGILVPVESKVDNKEQV